MRKAAVGVAGLVLLWALLVAPAFSARPPSAAGQASWTITGGPGGFIFSLVLSPNYSKDQTIFAGTFTGGVFKSADGGAIWHASNTGMINRLPWGVVLTISPNYPNDQTVFAGTYYYGVYRSTDGGASWSDVNSGLDHKVAVLAISPNYANDQAIFAGVRFEQQGDS